jgi:hypothetical protein
LRLVIGDAFLGHIREGEVELIVVVPPQLDPFTTWSSTLTMAMKSKSRRRRSTSGVPDAACCSARANDGEVSYPCEQVIRNKIDIQTKIGIPM